MNVANPLRASYERRIPKTFSTSFSLTTAPNSSASSGSSRLRRQANATARSMSGRFAVSNSEGSEANHLRRVARGGEAYPRDPFNHRRQPRHVAIIDIATHHDREPLIGQPVIGRAEAGAAAGMGLDDVAVAARAEEPGVAHRAAGRALDVRREHFGAQGGGEIAIVIEREVEAGEIAGGRYEIAGADDVDRL